MIKTVCILLAASLLAACAKNEPPPTYELTSSFKPSNIALDDGTVVSAKCLNASIEEFRGRPTGCSMERALASQVADKRDLVRPRVPGPALISEIYPQDPKNNEYAARVGTQEEQAYPQGNSAAPSNGGTASDSGDGS